MKELTYKESVEEKCRGCGVDPDSCGTWREQIACCVEADCSNFYNRPMPKKCRDGRIHNTAEITKVRAKVEQLLENRAARERNRHVTENDPSFDE